MNFVYFNQDLLRRLFQAHLIEILLPYPSAPIENLDEEEQSLELLYKDFQTFCVGHGCAGDWDQSDIDGRASVVYAEPLPSFEAPSITPDIDDPDGNQIKIPMAPLAGLVPGDDGLNSLENLI